MHNVHDEKLTEWRLFGNGQLTYQEANHREVRKKAAITTKELLTMPIILSLSGKSYACLTLHNALDIREMMKQFYGINDEPDVLAMMNGFTLEEWKTRSARRI